MFYKMRNFRHYLPPSCSVGANIAFSRGFFDVFVEIFEENRNDRYSRGNGVKLKEKRQK